MATAGAALFDGTADYLTLGGAASGSADSKKFTLLAFYKRVTINTSQRVLNGTTAIGGGSDRFKLAIGSGNDFRLTAWDTGGTLTYQRNNATAQTDTTNWHSLLWSVDIDAGAGNADHIYIDDSEDEAGGGIFTDATFDFTLAEWSVGSYPGGDDKWDGCLGPLGFWPGLYLDLTTEANRRLFHTGDSVPKLAATLNTSPIVSSITPSIWLTNGFATYQEDESGNSNDFTENGTLADCTGPEIEAGGITVLRRRREFVGDDFDD